MSDIIIILTSILISKWILDWTSILITWEYAKRSFNMPPSHMNLARAGLIIELGKKKYKFYIILAISVVCQKKVLSLDNCFCYF